MGVQTGGDREEQEGEEVGKVWLGCEMIIIIIIRKLKEKKLVLFPFLYYSVSLPPTIFLIWLSK